MPFQLDRHGDLRNCIILHIRISGNKKDYIGLLAHFQALEGGPLTDKNKGMFGNMLSPFSDFSKQTKMKKTSKILVLGFFSPPPPY